MGDESLKQGLRGVVEEIDEEGDVLMMLEGSHEQEWILKSEVCKLRRVARSAALSYPNLRWEKGTLATFALWCLLVCVGLVSAAKQVPTTPVGQSAQTQARPAHQVPNSASAPPDPGFPLPPDTRPLYCEE